ncbi:Nitrile-specifier protein 5 [Cyphellophora attinorum]|uniref:Nitrile-specifier protein 5 n=1 Tax=Cyphellophora attinorum TaxID=1664694 RepID=A0A0N1H6V8_9EURO|nr:Nitrile-specifier protein 5 [Phialophora attinorum]KPI38147.1 Nitrile-specifier protein 5 [Phialophora attinorum]
MAPLEENGVLWVLGPVEEGWARIGPIDDSAPKPEGRSYHAMTSDGVDKIYLHAGCPEKGRLSDMWSFSIRWRTWKQLADAPGPARGGASIAYTEGQVWRMNGFDGKVEHGGALDVYDCAADAWQTITYEADGKSGPTARSVCSLLALEVGGKPSLVTMFGESDPSNLGHAGAGNMLGDVWLFDIASKTWQLVETSGPTPPPRGWFDADVLTAKPSILVTGGLKATNERLDDAWILAF